MGTATAKIRLHKPPWTAAGSEVTTFATGLDHVDTQLASTINVMGFWDTTAGEWKAATRDGTTDDSAVINAAIAEAVVRGCRYVYLPGGTYGLDYRINLKRWATLIGDGMNTILKPSASFSTGLADGFGVVGLGESFAQATFPDIRQNIAIMKSIYIDLTDAPTLTCGVWLNNYCVSVLFDELVFFSDSTANIHMGVVVDNLRYDLTGAELGATNCNGTMFRDCEFSWLVAAAGGQFWKHAAFLVRGCNDNQTIVLDNCKWNKCGIPLSSMGPVTILIAPAVADLYTTNYPALTMAAGGKHSHFYFFKRNNIIDNGYFDTSGIVIQDHKPAAITSTDVGVPFLKGCINIGDWNTMRYYAPFGSVTSGTFTRTGDFQFTHSTDLTATLKDGHIIDLNTAAGNGSWWVVSGDPTYADGVTTVNLVDDGQALSETLTFTNYYIRGLKCVRTTGETAKFDVAGDYNTVMAVGRYVWVGDDTDMYRAKITAKSLSGGVTTVTVDVDPIPAGSNIVWLETTRQNHAVIMGSGTTAGGEIIIAPQNFKIWDESYANYHHVTEEVAAATTAAYDILYYNSSGRVAKAKADATSTMPALYMAAEGGSTGGTIKCYKAGSIVTNSSWTWGTVGATVYLSAATAGAITDSAPAGPGYVQKVGIVRSATSIEFKPDLYYIVGA